SSDKSFLKFFFNVFVYLLIRL
ncbi:hypothetical protein CP061683_1410B, partial [Chlamydia psittaci 06-1683]